MNRLRYELEIMYKGSFLYSRKLLWLWAKSSNDHKIKSELVKQIREIYGTQILVETGTYLGKMIHDQLNNFKQIHSIEISDYYYRIAISRFRKYPHVHLYFGDSSLALEGVLNKINSPVLFWLDGHYSGGKTGIGKTVTPLLDELNIIFNKISSPVVLIDDARYFLDENNHDYPNLNEINNVISNPVRNMNLEVRGDIICLLPVEPQK